MENFKKLISIILAILMIVPFGTFIKAENNVALSEEDKVKKLSSDGYVSGYEDGSLHLDKKIKRSEFSKLIVHALNKEDVANQLQGIDKPFTDVEKTHWANGIISVVKTATGKNNKISIINGYPDGKFKPESFIKYNEVIKMLVCLEKDDLTKEMVDNAVWPTSWINWAKELGVSGQGSGLDNVVDFSQDAIRGITFEMLYNAVYHENAKKSDFIDENVKPNKKEEYKQNEKAVDELAKGKPGRDNFYEPSEPYYPWYPTPDEQTPDRPIYPSIKTYEIKIADTQNGKVYALPQKAAKGDIVTLTTIPEEGYRLNKLIVKQGEKTIPVNGTQFVMPDGEVTVEAKFEKIEKPLKELKVNFVVDKTKGEYDVKQGTPILSTLVLPNPFDATKLKSMAPKVKAKDGYKFTGWDKEFTGELTEDTTFNAKFETVIPEKTKYTLTAPESVTVETKAADNKYEENTEIKFNVTVPVGQKIKSVKANDTELTVGADGKYSFKITSDTTIKVEFEEETPAPVKYKLTLPTGDIVTVINSTTDNMYEAGTKIEFTVKAPEGKEITAVTANNETLTPDQDGKYSFVINADTTINVVVGKKDTCPTEDKVKEEFANAVAEALKTIKLPKGITQKYENKVATVTLKNYEGKLEEISGSNAMKALKSLVDKNGLKSFTVDGTEYELTGKTEQELKGIVGQVLLSKAENLTEEQKELTISAKVKFKSSVADCEKVYEDDYTLKVVVESVCPTVKAVKEELKKATDNAIKAVELPQEKMTKTLSNDTVEVTLKEDVKLEDLKNSGTKAIVNLKSLINDNGLRSVQIGSHKVEVTKDDTFETLVEKILNCYKALRTEIINNELSGIINTDDTQLKITELTKKGLALFAGKEYQVTLTFKPSEVENYDGCTLGEQTLSYKINFVDDLCPTPYVLKNEFAKYVGEAISRFNLPEGITATYNEKERKAVVTITTNSNISGIANSGAMTELKKLVDEKGLISFKRLDGEEQKLKGLSDQELQSLILTELMSRQEEGKDTQSITVEVTIQSIKSCALQTTDKYTLELKLIKKLSAEEGKKYDDKFEENFAKVQESVNKQDRKGLFNSEKKDDTFYIHVNPDKTSTSILLTQGSGLATALIGTLTSNAKGYKPQDHLNKVTVIEVGTTNSIVFEKADLDLFAKKKCVLFICVTGGAGMENAAKKGFPGMSNSSTLGDMVNKTLTITYEYVEGNSIYTKTRTLIIDTDYK